MKFRKSAARSKSRQSRNHSALARTNGNCSVRYFLFCAASILWNSREAPDTSVETVSKCRPERIPRQQFVKRLVALTKLSERHKALNKLLSGYTFRPAL